jgi:hypothetical protein
MVWPSSHLIHKNEVSLFIFGRENHDEAVKCWVVTLIGPGSLLVFYTAVSYFGV